MARDLHLNLPHIFWTTFLVYVCSVTPKGVFVPQIATSQFADTFTSNYGWLSYDKPGKARAWLQLGLVISNRQDVMDP